MNPEYVKALNRRAHAYEHLGFLSEALLDYTASCIIDSFRNENSAQSVERLLKKVAEKKGKAILAGKKNLETWFHEGREYIKQNGLLCGWRSLSAWSGPTRSPR